MELRSHNYSKGQIKEHSEFKENSDSLYFFFKGRNSKPQSQGYILATFFFFFRQGFAVWPRLTSNSPFPCMSCGVLGLEAYGTTPGISTFEFTKKESAFKESPETLHYRWGLD